MATIIFILATVVLAYEAYRRQALLPLGLALIALGLAL